MLSSFSCYTIFYGRNPDNFNDRADDEEWFDCIEDDDPDALNDEEFFESRDGFVLDSNYLTDINRVSGSRKRLDFEKLRKFFLWKPVEAIKKTFDVTTQFVETVWFNSHICLVTTCRLLSVLQSQMEGLQKDGIS